MPEVFIINTTTMKLIIELYTLADEFQVPIMTKNGKEIAQYRDALP